MPDASTSNTSQYRQLGAASFVDNGIIFVQACQGYHIFMF